MARRFSLERLRGRGPPGRARLDPILPTLTDDPEALDRQFAALAQVGGAAAGGRRWRRDRWRQPVLEVVAPQRAARPRVGRRGRHRLAGGRRPAAD